MNGTESYPQSTPHISKRVILKVLKLIDNQYHRIFLRFSISFSLSRSHFISVGLNGPEPSLLLFIIICYKFRCWLKELNSNTKYSVSISSQTFGLSSHCLTFGFSLALSVICRSLQFRFIHGMYTYGLCLMHLALNQSLPQTSRSFYILRFDNVVSTVALYFSIHNVVSSDRDWSRISQFIFAFVHPFDSFSIFFLHFFSSADYLWQYRKSCNVTRIRFDVFVATSSSMPSTTVQSHSFQAKKV